MRKKRNRFTYDESAIIVSETETKKAVKNAKMFVKIVIDFIEENNPQIKLL